MTRACRAPRRRRPPPPRAEASEDGQPPEELLLVRLEQLVAPLDRRAQRALPGGRVARARGEKRQAPFKPREELVRVQQRDACCGKLDREREPVEPPTDLPRPPSAGTGRDESRALDEENEASSIGQRLDGVTLLAFDAAAARGSSRAPSVRRTREERGDRRCGLDDLLEVVEQDEQPLAGHVLDQGVVGADAMPRSRARRGRGRGALQRHPEDAVGELARPPRPRAARQAASCPFRRGPSASAVGASAAGLRPLRAPLRPTSGVAGSAGSCGRASSAAGSRPSPSW